LEFAFTFSLLQSTRLLSLIHASRLKSLTSAGELDVSNIQDADFEYDAFRNLYIGREEVNTDALRITISPYIKQDYVPSDPTLILLYGGPGTGKTTATRFSAEYTQRPLLSISSADIVKDDGKAEATFKQILNRAERWKAILLLENVELIFSKSDGKISHLDLNLVLLVRALETHRGLVFLTTKEVCLMDVYVFSRISLSIQFDRLSQSTKLRILAKLAENCSPGVREEVSQATSNGGEEGLLKDIMDWTAGIYRTPSTMH
jgi:AAA+ superfamily predicted ATPase